MTKDTKCVRWEYKKNFIYRSLVYRIISFFFSIVTTLLKKYLNFHLVTSTLKHKTNTRKKISKKKTKTVPDSSTVTILLYHGQFRRNFSHLHNEDCYTVDDVLDIHYYQRGGGGGGWDTNLDQT